ncbi:hypothetical protein K250101E9_39200 [Enterocloster aldenensis]
MKMAPEGIPGQQVLREKLAPLARPDLRDQWGLRGNQVLKGFRECRDRRGPRETQVLQEPPGFRARPVLQEPPESRARPALQEPPESRVRPALQDPPESRVQPALQALRSHIPMIYLHHLLILPPYTGMRN